MLTHFRAAKLFCLLADGLAKAEIIRRLRMSEHTIDRYQDLDQLPSQLPRPPRKYRTRKDPLAPYWSLIEERLTTDSRLRPFAVLDWLTQRSEDPANGLPQRVRSDSLSAAVNNLSDDREFNPRYKELLKHYGLQGHRINVRKPHENGDVESSHGHFKQRLDQALLLRGSRDFASRDDYLQFLRDLIRRTNQARETQLREERAVLRSLPAERLRSHKVLSLTVSDSTLPHGLRSMERSMLGTPGSEALSEPLEACQGRRAVDGR